MRAILRSNVITKGILRHRELKGDMGLLVRIDSW